MIRRLLFGLSACLTSALLLTTPAIAQTHYDASGTYWTNSSTGECAIWSHKFFVTGYPIPGAVTFALEAGTWTKNGVCSAAQLLPAGWIQNSAVRAYYWNGSAWLVYAEHYPNPQSNTNNSWVVYSSDEPQGATGWYYTRATHGALQTGGVHSYVSGSELPVQCFCGQ